MAKSLKSENVKSELKFSASGVIKVFHLSNSRNRCIYSYSYYRTRNVLDTVQPEFLKHFLDLLVHKTIECCNYCMLPTNPSVKSLLIQLFHLFTALI